MKIGMICYPSYGGSGVVATELGKQLAKRGHQVHFISYERPFKLNSFNENVFLHEVETMDYPLFKHPPYLISLAGKIVEVTRCFHLDLVHVHYAIPHTASALLAKMMLKDHPLPVVTTLHGTDITLVGQDPQFYEVTRFSIEASDGVSAVSHSLAQETYHTFGVERPIEVIPNFVDPLYYRRRSQGELRRKFAQPEEKILFHISNLRPVKRIEDVIRIFARVNSQVPSRLLLVGDGPDRLAAQSLAVEMGVADRIYFLGKQEGVVELLSLADLFLLPSQKESFGLVALEAMACRVPIIASRIGGIPEVVVDGETGFLLPVGEVEAMAAKAIELLTNASLHRRMAYQARQRSVEQFSADHIVTLYEALYRELVREGDKGENQEEEQQFWRNFRKCLDRQGKMG